MLVMTLLWGVTAADALSISATPSSVNAAYGQSTSVAIHYRFDTQLPQPLLSTTGNFIFNDAIIGTVNRSLTSQYSVSEVLTIPQYVVEKVIRAGGSSFRFKRNFNGNVQMSPVTTPVYFSEDANVIIHITPGSVASFSLKRIELYFDNMQKRNEVMVQRNFKGLKAYADIYYNGSGFLNGYWEVDGLIIERVNRFVPTGGKVTLATPSVPDLPTFDPGYHIVKFIVTNPETSFEVPEMVYWVKGAEEPTKRVLALINPMDGMDIPPDFPFAWEKMEKASVYLISFAKSEDKTVCFSALTRDTSYRIPPSVLAEYLSPGKKFLWSVKGFDTENNIIAESGVQSFYFKEAPKP
jgi:hypothetical protein